MHLPPLIFDLAIILAVAGIMSIIFQWLKQPVVLGYILAGVIVGPYTPPFELVKDIPGIQTWGELGVIFLMFTLGLEFSFRKLLNVGVTAGVTAGLEVIFFLLVGYGIGRGFGWSSMDSIFLGAMLSISSTTIIIKALDELKLKSHRFSSLIFGVLIVEDLFAILLLVGLTTIATSGNFSFMGLASAALNLAIVVGSWFITGYFLVPRLMSYIAKKGNNEMLTLVSIALCLSLVVLASHFGYSPALGSFIMGSILAETKVLHKIEDLMAPLRDLFGGIFFVSIGMLIDPKIMWEYKGTIGLLCLVTIFGKIFITSLGALISGQSFKNSVQVGFGLAQIGEFSFIIAGLGLALKATSNKLYPIGVAVSLVTTFTTPYLIKYSSAFADYVDRRLPWKLKKLMDRYVAWCEHRQVGGKKFKEIFELLSRWVMNGILVTLVFNLSFEYLLPVISSNLIELKNWDRHVTWLFAFIVSTPFLWGMVFTSRKNYLRIRKEKNTLKAIVVLLLPVLTSVWIGLLSVQHFRVKFILPITAVFLIVIYFALFKKLESYYRWLEKTFLSTFQEDGEETTPNKLASLAPWDSHLVNVSVHPNASLVNSSLLKSNLRQRFGVNVVAIQRGMQTIVAPKPNELILPGDTLVVLGTDEQIDSARPELEIPANISTLFPDDTNYRLRHLKVNPDSGISGKTIRQSGIREKYHAMVVGVERSQKRIINPDTDLEIQSDDVIWVVGERTMLDQLFGDLG
jgi:CPA2 family monovalent cation:H+ antiporter-2